MGELGEVVRQATSVLEEHLALRVTVILVATFVVAFGVEWLYRRIFRTIAQRTSSGLDDRVVDLLHPPIRTSIILVGLTAVAAILPLGDVVESVWGSIARTIAILVWTVAVTRVLSTAIRYLGTSGRSKFFQARTVPLFDVVQKVLLMGAAVYLVFVTWNIDVTGWVASAGIVGIAVGFAAKDTLANLFSGVFILVDAPYKIGDMIVLDTGERGRVTEVGMRSTRILTRDDVEVVIPNSAIGVAKITNESGGPHLKRRVDVRIGVAYSSDIAKVRRILEGVAEELEIVCETPEPRVRFREMADSSLVFSVLFWILDPEQKGLAVDQVNTRIFERFAEEGVEIPFPQRVVHMVGGASPAAPPSPEPGDPSSR